MLFCLCSLGSDAKPLAPPASKTPYTPPLTSKRITRAEGRGRRLEASPVRGAQRPGEHLPHRAHPEQVGSLLGRRERGGGCAKNLTGAAGATGEGYVDSEMFAGQKDRIWLASPPCASFACEHALHATPSQRETERVEEKVFFIFCG